MELKKLSRAVMGRLDRIILYPEARLQLSAVDHAAGSSCPKRSVHLSCRISLWRLLVASAAVIASAAALWLWMEKKKERRLKKKWKRKYLKRNEKMSKS